MSYDNPYHTPPTARSIAADDYSHEIRRVRINPIELLKRGYAMLGDQYWLFMGMSLVAVLIGSLVPLGILMPPLMVGLFLALIEREQGRINEFGTVFRGFNKFADSLIAYLVMIAAFIVVMIPLAIILVAAMIMFAAANASGTGEGETILLVAMLVFYPLLFVSSFLCYIPFVFTYQLIADRGLTGMEAVKMSARGVWTNLGGILLYMFVSGLISLVLVMMCYVPIIFFIPISFASAFVLYRDIYAQPIVDAQIA